LTEEKEPEGRPLEHDPFPSGECLACRPAPGALSVPRYVSGNWSSREESTGGSSIVTVCSMPDALSLGWSFAMLSAAHRDQASRVQLHEQVTSHPGVSDMLNP
jgi:hypothetical protein